jgi:hypothetical protein
VNEFAPITVNCEVRDDLIASIAVRIPTKAIIPKAMMHMVRIALTLFDLMALMEILRFSLKILAFISNYPYLISPKRK